MSKRRVLIIDDDRNSIRALTDLLTEQGYEVYSAVDGEEGLRKIKETKPEVILLDLVLPDQSGFKIAHEIKALPVSADIPIIAISLKREDVDKHIAAKSGIMEYVEKPIDYDRLLYYIKNVLAP